MQSKGIRILDKKGSFSSVNLYDILKVVKSGPQLQWSIAFLYTDGEYEDEMINPEFEDQINDSENGISISWADLTTLSQKDLNLSDITLAGAQNKEDLIRYIQNSEMYGACEIVIEKVDGNYWEVFSKDEKLINVLAQEFKDVEFLEPDFMDEEETTLV